MKQSRLAQRKLGVSTKTKRPKKHWKRNAIFLAVIFVVLFTIGVFHFGLFSEWDGKSKISVAIQRGSGDVSVVILDPVSSTISTMIIPNDSQVQAAHGLGTWKMGSITRLGEDKGFGQGFLKDTIIKSFNFPVDRDSSEVFLNLVSGDLFKEVRAIGGVSSFSFLDKVKIAVFSLQISSASRFDVDLVKTGEIERVRLVDGSLGFEVSGVTPTNIESYFTFDLNGMTPNLVVNNATGKNVYGNMVGKVVEMLGVNVASVRSLPLTDSDCVVTGVVKDIVVKIADVLSCKTSFVLPKDNFDVQIDMGTNFMSRF